MKNITFSAQEEAIEQARRIAALRHSTLNELFREWLHELRQQEGEGDTAKKLHALWERTNYLHVGKKLSRDERNER